MTRLTENFEKLKDVLLKNKTMDALDLARRYVTTGTNAPLYVTIAKPLSNSAFNNYETEINENAILVIRMLKTFPYQDSSNPEFRANALTLLARISGIDKPEIASFALNTAVNLCNNGRDILDLACKLSHYRGFGRQVKKILSRWYLEQDPRKLLTEVINHPEVTIYFDGEKISFTHRKLVRRLHLRGSDDLQDACFRMIKGYRGDPSEVPKFIDTFDQINHLDFVARGSVETAIQLSKGLDFDIERYAPNLRNNEEFLSEMFYSCRMSFDKWQTLADYTQDKFFSDEHAERIGFIFKTWLDREECRPVDLLLIRHRLKMLDIHPEIQKELLYQYKNIESEPLEDSIAIVFLKHVVDNTEAIIHAYDFAHRNKCNLVIVRTGVLALTSECLELDELLSQVPEVKPTDEMILSLALINILSGSQKQFKKIYVTEHSFDYVGSLNGFLNTLDTYLTGKNKTCSIVHHLMTEGITQTHHLLAEPRHGQVLTVIGSDTKTGMAAEVFLGIDK